MTNDLCVCGPMTRAQNHCDCGAEESVAELRWGGCCGDPGDCCEAVGRATLDRPYFDLDGNEGTFAEVYSCEYDAVLSGYQDWLNELLFEHKDESDQVTWLGDNRWLIIPVDDAKDNIFVVEIKRAKLT